MQKNPEDEWKKLATPPIVVAQGELDKIMNPMNAINFYEKIKSEDKEFWWYPNTWNNILLEKQYENFEKRAIEWFNKRL